jgi:ABC-type transport system involved in cytochrome bd biosynthesis fused ATPase/permease subunit
MVGLWIVVFNWVFLVVSVAAIGFGIWLTRGQVRLLLAVSLGLFLLRMLLGRVPIADGSENAMLAYSVLQGLLALATTGTMVAAAVTGFREAKASQKRVAELTEETSEAWAQPEGSPDPRLLAD